MFETFIKKYSENPADQYSNMDGLDFIYDYCNKNVFKHFLKNYVLVMEQ